jgi:hypothetical protein
MKRKKKWQKPQFIKIVVDKEASEGVLDICKTSYNIGWTGMPACWSSFGWCAAPDPS